MVKDKRNRKVRQARAAKKKAKVIKSLKARKPAAARPAAKKKTAQALRKAKRPDPRKTAPAKTPARAAVKPAAKEKAQAKPVAAKVEVPAGKKGKAAIQSAKHALELLEAKVNAGLKAAKDKKGRGNRKARREEWLAATAELPKEDAETRRTRLKNLIKLGKDRGFLTYVEINDHLPDDLVDAEQIESIISTFNDMGIQVYDQAPDQESLLITEAAPVASNDEDVEEQAEAALSTVDSEFGRTTDPVRMYMREMGSVELLTREGEIEIAKRIEEGLRHMVQAISACPTTVQEILDLAEKVEKDEMRIDEVVDGLIDPNAKDDFDPRKAESEQEEETIEEEIEEEEDDEGAAARASLMQLRAEALEKFARIRRLYDKLKRALENKGPRDKDYVRAREQISNELMTIRFTARTVERL
ncbi:MAG TPA: RNA polymerase sigma factor region1.1 domain-containing protein, partial [Burkholderiales bacterium]|nr:RNA polymerase sigma factor region1.1 domain-containing protein [Burkholderiales bacterium]